MRDMGDRRDVPDKRNALPLHELRFSTPGDWAAAFDRVIAHPATQLCVAERHKLTLRVRTGDPSALRLEGRILEPRLLEAI